MSFNLENPDELETKIFDAVMDASEYVRLQICKSDEDWQAVQRLMRVDSGLSVFYNCKENDIAYDPDDYVYDFDLIINEK